MGDSQESLEPVPVRDRLGAFGFKGLGAKLVLAQLLVAALLVGTAWVARQSSQAAQARLIKLYDHRVLPLHRLSGLADALAIDFVDTVHKVSDASLSAAEGAERLERVRRDADRGWRDATQLMTDPAERQVKDELSQVLARALRSLTKAQALMNADDVERLVTWRRTELYVHVDPLTEQLQRQIGAALGVAQAELVSVRSDLRRAALESALSLSGAGLLAIAAGLFVATRFLASLRRVERVVEAAAAGDLSQRIALPGSDELSAMAGRIDAMIGAMQKSQAALSRQAEALARSEAEARAASAAKSAFLGNVSHELRTPLNVILGYAQALAREQGQRSEVQHGLSRIEEAGNHLLQLIEDVIGAARLDQTALAVRLAAFAPAQLLENVELMLGERARRKSLAFELSTRGRVPASVTGDRRRLLQVLLNLVGNAVKFTQKGGIFVHLSWEDERLRFEVKDTGPGISKAEQATLFQTFSQGSLGRKSGQGTGLGLHISRGIARALGGELTLESEPGRGCTFICEVDAPEGEPDDDDCVEPAALSAEPNHGLAPMLVVDDRATNREVLCTLLRVTGFDSVQTADGAAALAHLERARVSLVWLDMKMPGLDGAQVLELIRALERRLQLPRIPVVLITASVVDLDAERAQRLGFDAWVPKPFRADAVLEAVRHLTGVKLRRAAVRQSDEAPRRRPPFDMLSLTSRERAHLRDLLMLGDVSAAATWARELGPRAAALVAEITSFRTDALLASLEHPGAEQDSQVASSQ